MDATRGPILFRCDGTPDQGWESFYQCLSLAAALQRRRRGTHFLSYLEPLSLATVINRGNNDWAPAEQRLGHQRHGIGSELPTEEVGDRFIARLVCGLREIEVCLEARARRLRRGPRHSARWPSCSRTSSRPR